MVGLPTPATHVCPLTTLKAATLGQVYNQGIFSMRKILFLSFLSALFALVARADSKETVTVKGTVTGQFATTITFDGDNVTLTYEDGTMQTALMDDVNIALSYVAVLGEAPGFQNIETIKTFGNRTVAVMVNRELKADTWQTICLPFGLNAPDIATIFGEGTRVATLESVGATQINFATTSEMAVDMPYILYPTQDVNTFSLDAAALSHYAEGATATVTPYAFVGTLDAVTPTGNAYDLGNDSQVTMLAPGSTVKALRAYLTSTTGAGTATTFSIDGEDTGLVTSLMDEESHATTIYNLHGQQIGTDSCRLPKGIYIVNGKKLVVNH